MNLHDRNGHQALNLARLPIPPPARGVVMIAAAPWAGGARALARLREEAVQHDGVGRKQGGHHDRQPREVSLDDVRAALRGRREADAAEARVAARVHEHERDERGAEEHLEDGEDGDHRTRHGTGRYAARMAAGDDARARIQRLLVTGDNRLKQGVDPEKVRESYEQALAAAREAGLEDAVRPLVEIRLADLDARESP